MIVLDEQLMGRNIELDMAAWYRGKIQFITDLRPHTVIKDEAMPELLRQQNQPTFVTINESDFWRKIAVDKRYCVVCFNLPDSRVREIPSSLRSLFRNSAFNTKDKRMGKVIRIAKEQVSYYSLHQRQVKTFLLSATSR